MDRREDGPAATPAERASGGKARKLSLGRALGRLPGATIAASRPYVVRGESMDPSFRDGDQLLVDRRAGTGPSRGDVVVLHDPRDHARHELKRIVGLPGEEVRFRDGLLHIDGEPLDEPYLGGLPATLGAETSGWRLGSGEYFVMGDNRVRSTDSRKYGPVAASLIVGRARFRYWPPRRWGSLR